MSGFMLRCIWPILDERMPYRELVRAAKGDVPGLATQAHARLAAPGRFSIAESVDVPGSGRTTATVLVFEAPAVRAPARAYRAMAS